MNLDNPAEHPGPDRLAASRFLSALYNSAPASAWAELRFQLRSGMRQAFYPITALGAVAEAILAQAAVSDVFVGVVPRFRHGGRRADLIKRSAVVWADCDDADSVLALAEFRPAPSMVVASGTAQHRHAYWLLRDPIELESMEAINHRLALALGADRRSADAARILRPAGSLNCKRWPPAPVRLLRLAPGSAVSIGELYEALPVGPADVGVWSHTREFLTVPADPLRAISPRVYVARLTGQPVGRSGKIRCPFHDDRTPSLHVYEAPGRGWYCFGCGRGGSIYDLAGLLWRRDTSGESFLRLRRELALFLS